jgi:hypothetical protein
MFTGLLLAEVSYRYQQDIGRPSFVISGYLQQGRDKMGAGKPSGFVDRPRTRIERYKDNIATRLNEAGPISLRELYRDYQYAKLGEHIILLEENSTHCGKVIIELAYNAAGKSLRTAYRAIDYSSGCDPPLP